jgi:hypothetical protein
MLQKMRVLLLVCITAVLAACGGGGGEEATPSFAGNYLENFTLTTNTCNLSLTSTLVGTDTVTQSGRNIGIVSGGLVFTGTVDADNGGFTVVGSVVSSGITTVGTIKYRTTVTGASYSLNYQLVGGACTVVYTGTATKI